MKAALCIALLSTTIPRMALGADLTAAEIVNRSLERNAFGFENAVARLTLAVTGKDGAERVRKIEMRSLVKGGRGKSIVRFLSPADVQGTAFMVIENVDRDDDQYLYLPALGKVKRITQSQRNQKFMGTDWTYADLESRNLRKATSKRLADGTMGNNPAYVIESVPTEIETTQYGKTISWIHTTSFVPLKVEFYDKALALLKTLVVKKLEKRGDSWVVMDSTVTNSQAGTGTHLIVDSLETNQPISDAEFSEQALSGG